VKDDTKNNMAVLNKWVMTECQSNKKRHDEEVGEPVYKDRYRD
jgi:hypothetical protein